MEIIAPGIFRTPMTDAMKDELRASLCATQVFPNTRLGEGSRGAVAAKESRADDTASG